MFDDQESDEFELAPELATFRRQLEDFTPTPPRIDRDQLMFEAGRAAQRASSTVSLVVNSAELAAGPDPDRVRPKYFWPAATATMTAATLLLSAMLIADRANQQVAQPPTAPHSGAFVASTNVHTEPLDNQPWSPHATCGYLGLRNVALTHGIGAAPSELRSGAPGGPPPTTPTTNRQLFRELLPEAEHQRS